MATKDELADEVYVLECWQSGHTATSTGTMTMARCLSACDRIRGKFPLASEEMMGAAHRPHSEEALRRTRAELAALTAPAPQTIEERFPRGCRVRVTSTSGASTEHTVTGHLCDRFREGLATADGPLWFIPGWTFERLDTPAPESAQPVPMVGDVWRVLVDHVITEIDQTGRVFAGARWWVDAAHLQSVGTFVRRAQPQPAPPKPAPQCEARRVIDDRSDWRPRVVVLAGRNEDDETVPVTVGAPFTRGEWAVTPAIYEDGSVNDANPLCMDWSVSYIPNGRFVATCLDFDAARALCEALGPIRDASPNRLGVRDRFSPGYERAAAIVAEMTGDDSELPL